MIAQDSGHRETDLTACLARLEANSGDPLAALEYSRRGHSQLPRRRQHRHCACHSGFARRVSGSARTLRTSDHHCRILPQSPHRNVVPEINTAIADLREVLGDQTHESLAHEGETITAAEMATYAYDQIDQARTGLGPSRFT